MRAFTRILMAAALVLSAGIANAAAEAITGTNPAAPQAVAGGGDAVYDDGFDSTWGTDATGGVYGSLDSVKVTGDSWLLIGTGAGGGGTAAGDLTVSLPRTPGGTGDFVIVSTADNEMNQVELKAGAGVTTLAIGGSLVIGAGINNTNALYMDSANTALIVDERSRIGDAVGADTTGEAILWVAGDNTHFKSGLTIGQGGMLSNNFSVPSDATVRVGDRNAAGNVDANIYMHGGLSSATIDSGGDKLTLVDDAAAASLAPRSSLVVLGGYTQILGDVDATSLRGMEMRGGYLSAETLAVRDFAQTQGYFVGQDVKIAGTSATVTGGVFQSNVTFTNPELDVFAIGGSSYKTWESSDDYAILAGWTTVTGYAGAGQSIKVGPYGSMSLAGGMTVRDMDIDIARQGVIAAPMDGDVLDFGATIPGGNTLSVRDPSSISFVYRQLWSSDFSGHDSANPFAMFVKNSTDDVLDVAAFSFSGMFGRYGFGMADNGMAYGLVDWGNSNVLFDGTRGDAAAAHASIAPSFGGTVNRGLSDMAYRAALTHMLEVFDGPDYSTLEPLGGWGAEHTPEVLDSFNVNLTNLLDIAAGRADRSTVALYNGSAAFGVNQVSAATALSHARVGLGRADEMRRTYGLVRNAVAGSDALASTVMNSCFANRFWAGGFGLWEDADARNGFDGYKYKSGGMAVGYDRMLGSNFLVGASFAATFGDYEDKSALAHDSDIDSYSFNLYATYTHHSGFFASAFGGYTYSDNDIRELRLHNLVNPLWNTADYHTDSWLAGGRLGYDWKPAERFTLTPSVGVTHIGSRSSAHDEYLDNVHIARYGSMKTNQTYLPVELALGYDAYAAEDRKLNLAVNLGYAYNFENDAIKGTIWQGGFNNGTPYAAVSREPGHHTFTAGAGLKYTMGRLDVGAKYEYARKAKMDSHRVYGTIGISF